MPRKRRYRDVSTLPVMRSRCATCPFNPSGCKEVRALVEARSLKGVNQTCHHSGGLASRDTHLCRGARDFQLQLFHRLGLLAEPTDAAWDAKRKELA